MWIFGLIVIAIFWIGTTQRIIAASGIHDNEKVAKSIGRQVRQFLPKPFTADVLLRAVAGAVAGS